MKHILPLVTVVFLVACGGAATPSQSSVQTAIAQTQQAMPTATASPAPTFTVPPTPTLVPTPIPTVRTVPDLFKTQAQRAIEEGSKLTGMTKTGLTYVQLRDQLGVVQGAYQLVDSSWPESVPDGARTSFQSALKGWQLTLKLWKAKIDKLDEPNEYREKADGPAINGYDTYLDYMGSNAILLVHEDTFIVSSYRGKKYLPFDENISELMTLATGYFNTARDQLMLALE